MALTSPGTAIRRARQRKGWTQDQLATALGVSLRAVNDWENDRTLPRNLAQLEDVLGISLSGGEAEPQQPEDDRPQWVRDNWDLEAVHGTWNDPLIPRDTKLGMIRWYLDSRELGRRRQNGPS